MSKRQTPTAYVETEHGQYVVRALGETHRYSRYPLPFTGKNREQEMVQHAVGPTYVVKYQHGMRTYTAYDLVPV